MLRTFNNGLGLVIVVAEEDSSEVLLRLKAMGETGYVIGNNDPTLLAMKIDELLYKIDDGEVSPTTIRESIRRYDWENIADSISRELYREVIAKTLAVA